MLSSSLLSALLTEGQKVNTVPIVDVTHFCTVDVFFMSKEKTYSSGLNSLKNASFKMCSGTFKF